MVYFIYLIFKEQMRLKTLYILPNALTTLNLFAGFVSIIYSIQFNFVIAAYAIVLAAFFDLLDGRVARMTKSTSAFGAEYDSLCDLVSFGLAPALLLYQMALHPLGRFGWLSAFFFLACGAIRLARFNVQGATEELDQHFQGLPIPLAAGIIASAVLTYQKIPFNFKLYIPALILCFVLGLIMVSNIKYRNFKNLSLKKRWPSYYLSFFVLLIISISYLPEISLFIFFLFYTLLGIVLGFVRKSKQIINHNK